MLQALWTTEPSGQGSCNNRVDPYGLYRGAHELAETNAGKPGADVRAALKDDVRAKPQFPMLVKSPKTPESNRPRFESLTSALQMASINS